MKLTAESAKWNPPQPHGPGLELIGTEGEPGKSQAWDGWGQGAVEDGRGGAAGGEESHP